MEQVNSKKHGFIDFYSDSSMVFWTRKLNVTQQQLCDAILNTGSLCIRDIKKYLGISKPVFSLNEFLNRRRK